MLPPGDERPTPSLLPWPDSLTATEGRLTIAHARIRADDALAPAASRWRAMTEEAFGTSLDGAVGADAGGRATTTQVRFDRDAALPAGGFSLRIAETGVTVRAADASGAHAATQALRQLAGPDAFRRAPVASRPLTLPFVEIGDHPRFAWRGVLLDVARHFLPKHDVLRFVDLAAAHRLNRVQLHLTDDQGWRVASDRHPRLTEVGAWRAESTTGPRQTGVPDGRPHGGFYTLTDLREITAYARARGVTIVPEVDVPGHVQAAVAAYPWLGAAGPTTVRTTWGISEDVLDPSERSLAFFRDVLDEVMGAVDSPYVAVGGDEVPTTAWKRNPAVVARAAELGLAGVADLHGWFVGALCEHVLAAGRRPVVWDEAFKPRPDGSSNLPSGTIVTSWRGWTAGARALAAGHDVVMAPEQVVYLDHRASDSPDEPIPVGFVHTVRDVYAFDPMPAEAFGAAGAPATAGRVLGAQAEVWSEHLDSARAVDYAAYPRLAAFAEAVWSSERDDPDAFVRRLERDHLPRLDAYGVEYRPPGGPHPWQQRPGVAGRARDLDAELSSGGLEGVGGWVEDGGGAGGAGRGGEVGA